MLHFYVSSKYPKLYEELGRPYIYGPIYMFSLSKIRRYPGTAHGVSDNFLENIVRCVWFSYGLSLLTVIVCVSYLVIG